MYATTDKATGAVYNLPPFGVGVHTCISPRGSSRCQSKLDGFVILTVVETAITPGLIFTVTLTLIIHPGVIVYETPPALISIVCC